MSLNGGYAMIKYNSTQEELQIAYRSKKPALFYDENQRAHWAVIEETATQSVNEETQEPITLYEYSYRLLDEESGGSEVHLYHHCVFAFIGGLSFHVNIYNSNATSFKYNTLLSYIREECNCTDSISYISASGAYVIDNNTYGVIGVGGGFNKIQCAYINESGNRLYNVFSSSANFNDTITQIF